MNISMNAIVSNSDMIKNYKKCREKAEEHRKIFIMKDNQLDAVLFSIKEYERVSIQLENIERLDDQKISKVIEP